MKRIWLLVISILVLNTNLILAGPDGIGVDPAKGDRHWKAPVASQASLPATGDSGDIRITLDTGSIYGYINNAWAQISGGSTITSLNGLTGAVQTFATVGTSGTAPTWTSSGTAHTLNIPMASATSVTAGLLSKTDYDTFSGAVLTSQASPQTIGNTTNRLTKLWATDITVTNKIVGSITGNADGNAATVTNGVYTTGAGTVYLTPSGSAALLTSFPTLNQDTTGKSAKTDALNSATTVVNVSSATAPSNGQVLTATSSTVATWQTPIIYSISDKIENYQVLNTDLGSGTTFTMSYATLKTFTLPSSADLTDYLGKPITFVKVGAGQVTIQAGSGQYIADSSSAGTIYNAQTNEIYATITLVAITTTQWVIVGGMGTWTTN